MDQIREAKTGEQKTGVQIVIGIHSRDKQFFRRNPQDSPTLGSMQHGFYGDKPHDCVTRRKPNPSDRAQQYSYGNKLTRVIGALDLDMPLRARLAFSQTGQLGSEKIRSKATSRQGEMLSYQKHIVSSTLQAAVDNDTPPASSSCSPMHSQDEIEK